eukprot:6200780-Pleurochrysis_carterae.AAC.9
MQCSEPSAIFLHANSSTLHGFAEPRAQCLGVIGQSGRSLTGSRPSTTKLAWAQKHVKSGLITDLVQKPSAHAHLPTRTSYTIA